MVEENTSLMEVVFYKVVIFWLKRKGNGWKSKWSHPKITRPGKLRTEEVMVSMMSEKGKKMGGPT